MNEFYVGFTAALHLLRKLQDDAADPYAHFDAAVAELESDGTDIHASGRADGFLAGLEDFLDIGEDSDSER